MGSACGGSREHKPPEPLAWRGAGVPVCCPPGSHPASDVPGSPGEGYVLRAGPAETGLPSGGLETETPTLAAPDIDEDSGLDVYVAGGQESSRTASGKRRCLMVFTDVCGFNAGRHREQCDALARALRCPVFMPDLFRGDPPHAPVPGDSWLWSVPAVMHNAIVVPGMLTRVRSRCSPEQFVSDTRSLLPLVQEKCGDDVQIGCVGFCMGAWVAAHCQTHPLFAFAVGFHPALNLEKLFWGSEEDLVAKVQRPMFLMPAGNDPDNVKPGGDLINMLAQQQAAHGEEQRAISLEFPRMLHGWMTRGDDWGDPAIAEDRAKGMEAAVEFIEQQFSRL